MFALVIGTVALVAIVALTACVVAVRYRRRTAGRPRPDRAARISGRLPGRRIRIDDLSGGGPYLHWVPDRRGGWRLAGDFIPEPVARRPRSQRTAPRRGPRRSG